MDFTEYKSINFDDVELKQLFIDGIRVWKADYTNLVPNAIDTDGSIYQGTGFIEGYRLNSSGGLTVQENTITTGFMRCKAADIIRMAGVDYKPISGYCYLVFYDSAFTLHGSINIFPSSISSNEDGYWGAARGICKFKNNGYDITPTIENKMTIFDNYVFTDSSQIAYFHINGYGNGTDMIVTRNEEID